MSGLDMSICQSTQSLIIAVVISAMVAACHDESTSVRLEIASAPSLALDGLAIIADSGRHVVEMIDSVQLLVPEAWAGIARRFEVDGTLAEGTVTVGADVVTPIAGHVVTAIVTRED